MTSPKINALSKRLESTANEITIILDHGRLTKGKGLDSQEVDYFMSMYSTLERLYLKFDSVWDMLVDEYEDLGKSLEFPSEAQNKLKNNVRRYYYECTSTFRTINNALSARNQPSTSSSDITRQVTINESSSSHSLPKISLPKFDGNVLLWPKWRDTYKSLIHDNDRLSDIHKFHYLTTSLTSTALSVINHLPIEQQNYELAWQGLIDAFDNKRMLANAYLNQILSFKPLEKKTSIDNLKTFICKISDSISAFQMLNIENEGNFILFYLAIRCLDPETRQQFEIANKSIHFPTFDVLNKFIRERCLAMQLAEHNTDFVSNEKMERHGSALNSKGSNKSFNSSKPNSKTFFANKVVPTSNISTNACFVCKEKFHFLNVCPKFTSASVEARQEFLKKWQGCKNCFSSKHSTYHCESTRRCKQCGKKHNTLLHLGSSEKVSTNANEVTNQIIRDKPGPSSEVSQNASGSVLTSINRTSTVVLGTLLADFQDTRGKLITLRGIVDCGSQYSFITSKCANKLGLNVTSCPTRISGIGQTLFEGAKGYASCKIKSKTNLSINLSFHAYVVKNISGFLPAVNLPSICEQIFSSYHLADPQFWRSAPIDFLLGADLYANIMQGNSISIDKSLPSLFPSIFGNIVMGPLHNGTLPNNCVNSFVAYISNDDLNESLSKFWHHEEVEPLRTASHPEHDWCEQHFQQTHRRLPTGQYVVKLPFKSGIPSLSNSDCIAKKRFHNLEIKLQRNTDVFTQYKDFLTEYELLNHMTITEKVSKYIIPHHPITKEDRNQIKLRVVFDASSKTSLGSLNDQLYPGPKLQRDIRDILLNWRIQIVAIVADVVKMYRQIIVDEEDRCFQHIYWRNDPAQELKKYELNTVTYGLTCSPWLALRVLKQLVLDHGHKYPKAAEAVSRDIFVDDIVTGSKNLDEAQILQEELINLFREGGFQLKKWASNKSRIIDNVEENNFDPVSFEQDCDFSLKILGLVWFPSEDMFSYRIQVTKISNTKRGILSQVASLYDPLGFIAPTTVLMKYIIQCLWKLGLGWDEDIPIEIQNLWNEILNKLSLLSKLRIPRCVCSNEADTYQIVGFADASSKAYCACLYLRTISSQSNHTSVFLLISKTRLAPVKSISIPKLELCAAVLLVKLYRSMAEFIQRLDKPVQEPRFFTDSSVTLGWINTLPCNLKVFVGNRVTTITNITSPILWSHVSTKENPSDLGSRGILPDRLLENKLWWNGPIWLSLPQIEWPKSTVNIPDSLPETQKAFTLFSTNAPISFDITWMKRFSNYFTLLRVTSRIRRLFYNRRHKTYPRLGNISIHEINESLFIIIKRVQHNFYGQAQDDNYSQVISKLSSLDLFLDPEGILRVGGRLRHTLLPFHQKHPILLPRQSHLAKLIVDWYHKLFLHPGKLLLQSVIQQKYWIPGLRLLINQRHFRCLTCFKSKAKPIEAKMGDLPSSRFYSGHAFLNVATDIAGPFMLRENLRRKSPLSKGYLCIFCCMSTKALHLELITNLTTDCFLAALDRFISRRGMPLAIYSDNGSTYIGASNKLKEFWTWFKGEHNLDVLCRYSTQLGIQWHFMPPYSPNFAGLAESGVKSVKTLLRKLVGEACLTYEEAFTFFHKIEAVLNSRPISLLSAEPAEISYLSPGHFLVGRPLLANPEPSFVDEKSNLLSRWQLVKKLSDRFWLVWKNQYLSTLQNRVKWHKYRPDHPSLKKDDIVLIKEDNCSQMYWPIARVEKIHPGQDGVVRVVTVNSKSSSYKRPVRKLIPLLPVMTPSFDD